MTLGTLLVRLCPESCPMAASTNPEDRQVANENCQALITWVIKPAYGSGPTCNVI